MVSLSNARSCKGRQDIQSEESGVAYGDRFVEHWPRILLGSCERANNRTCIGTSERA